MADVYVVQDPGRGRDLSSADRLAKASGGTMRICLAADAQPGMVPTHGLLKLRKELQDIRPEDMICWPGGDPTSAVLAGIVLAERARAGQLDSVQWLRWERERDIDGTRRSGLGYYVPVTIQLRQG